MILRSSWWLNGLVAVSYGIGVVAAADPAPAVRSPAQTKADEATSELLKTFVEELIAITPGEGEYPDRFSFGSPQAAKTPDTASRDALAARDVAMTQPFAIARYEVTQELYAAVMGKNPSRWQGRRNSVELVSVAEASTFCERLTKLLRDRELIGDREQIRLPTEIEWEYCCRAGTTTVYSFGDEAQAEGERSPRASLLDKYGWHTGNAAGNDPPVGAKAPNPWGLYDVHGYLWEFVTPAVDGQGDGLASAPADPAEKPAETAVIRGGSWKDAYPALTSTSRRIVPATTRDDAIGFRCVRAAVR